MRGDAARALPCITADGSPEASDAVCITANGAGDAGDACDVEEDEDRIDAGDVENDAGDATCADAPEMSSFDDDIGFSAYLRRGHIITAANKQMNLIVWAMPELIITSARCTLATVRPERSRCWSPVHRG